jgi:hypothetical protein
MPKRVGSRSRPLGSPASRIAWSAAPAANFVCRPQYCQSSARSPSAVTSQSRTSAEILVGNREASNTVVRPTPDLPATRFFQSSSTVTPSGVTQPTPVTTTLRLPAAIRLPSSGFAAVAAHQSGRTSGCPASSRPTS